MNPGPAARPLIGFGGVRHTRLRPRRLAFAYPTSFLMLPLRAMRGQDGALPRNRWAPIAFWDRDHGDGRGPEAGGALAWLEDLLTREGITDADGEVWLQCYPRVLGHTFKPVSFWWIQRRDGSLRAVLAEVNNTFGERHCYLLDRPREGAELRADKVFHVSPFCDVAGGYRFRFLRAQRAGEPPRVVVRVDHDDAAGPLIQTSWSGTLHPLDATHLRQAWLAHPLLTLGVVWRIHWQALRLWWRGTGVRRKPSPPADFVTRQTPPVHGEPAR